MPPISDMLQILTDAVTAKLLVVGVAVLGGMAHFFNDIINARKKFNWTTLVFVIFISAFLGEMASELCLSFGISKFSGLVSGIVGGMGWPGFEWISDNVRRKLLA